LTDIGKNRKGSIVVGFLFHVIGGFGLLSIADLIIHFNQLTQSSSLLKILFYTFLFLVFFPWSVPLPSGAKWKPAMAFVFFSMLAFPEPLSLFVVVPGVLFSSIKNKGKPWDFFVTIGHLSLGILVGRVLYLFFLANSNHRFPQVLLVMIVGLFGHFIVNRLISVVILTHRKTNGLKENFEAVLEDLNWSYLSIYSLSLVMIMIDHAYNYPGILVLIFLLVTLFKSADNYQKYKVIEKKAFTDALTGAENRAAWELFIGQQNGENGPGTLVMMDLDHFKSVNDSYGHTEGDRILREFVHHIQSKVSDRERLFRYGGDEFVLYIPHVESDASAIHRRFEAFLKEQNNEWKQEGLCVSISYGAKSYQSPLQLKAILDQADELMYQNKNGKKSMG
jgi:diguanylate cyclase (GGDEF)-like protein